ncbi:pro-FMRFamide-related neuropeptide FF isoform X2 [Arapaima gigas]
MGLGEGWDSDLHRLTLAVTYKWSTYTSGENHSAPSQLMETKDIEDLGSSEVKENLLALTLQNLFQRPHRYRPLLYQPQRFGREARGGLRPQFWSMMTPQRFGKK